jgi:Xaa-Pro dipeptidase
VAVKSALAYPSWMPEDLRPLLEAEYAQFSESEMARRAAAIDAAMASVDADHLLLYGSNRNGSAPFWLTGWPTTAEVVAVHSPGLRDALFVQYANHVPLARRLAKRADVEWGGPVDGSESALRRGLDELARRGARTGRVALLGPFGAAQQERVADRFGRAASLSAAYVRLRTIKSKEEIDWLRVGAAFSDASIRALLEELQPGLTVREVADIVERAYVRWGGTNGIHYIGVTSMQDPVSCVPAQFVPNRRIERGDVLVIENSAQFWDYSGQVLRSFAVGAEPTAQYRRLHDVAEGAFEAVVRVLRPGARAQDVVEATSIVEESGFTTLDDVVHGYGGGYLQPVLGSKSRPNGTVPEMTLEAGMCVVVQPNVVTRDHSAGVQTGELVTITPAGAVSLHTAPRGFLLSAQR